MNLSLILLKQGLTLIAQTDEMDYEPKVHLLNPFTVSGKTKLTLTRWPEHTEDDHILLHSENLLTVCEPTKALRKAYMTKAKLTEADLKPKPERVILNEEERLPPPQFEDEYEPEYIEE